MSNDNIDDVKYIAGTDMENAMSDGDYGNRFDNPQAAVARAKEIYTDDYPGGDSPVQYTIYRIAPAQKVMVGMAANVTAEFDEEGRPVIKPTAETEERAAPRRERGFPVSKI